MKKAVFMATIIPISIGLENTAIAAEPQSAGQQLSSAVFGSHFSRDFTAAIGVKAWFNKWDLPVVLSATHESDQNAVVSYNSEAEATWIPVLSFRYKNFLVSGSYFPKTDYSFGAQSLDFPFFTPPGGEKLTYFDSSSGRYVGISGGAAVKMPIPSSMSAERSEWDINVGYYFHRSVLVTAGYKRIDRQFSLYGNLPDDFSLTLSDQAGTELGTVDLDGMKAAGINTAFNVENDSHTDGLTLGIASAVSLHGRFGLYGNFAVGWLETTDQKESFDSEYYLGELGLLYSPQFEKVPVLNAAAVYLGYRFQFLNDDVTVGNSATDSTEGFVLGVNLIF